MVDFLKKHRLDSLDGDEIMRSRSPQVIDVQGRPVFLFDLAFDIHDSLISDSISISQQPHNMPIPLHMHDYIEMMFVYRGSCRIVIKERERLLNEGDLIMIEQWTPHSVKAATEQDIVINIIMKRDFLSPSFLSRLTRQSIISRFMLDSVIDNRQHHRFLIFRPGLDSPVIDVMEQIMCEFFDRDLYSGKIIDSFLVALFSMLIRSSSLPTGESMEVSPNGEGLLIEFLQYIEENYKDCSLAKMGSRFGFHPNYLSSLLKKGTGKSFKELLQIQRLNQAALFLSNSNMTIPDIAEEVGYSSLTFFYKKFKEMFEATPYHYRKFHQQQI